MNLPELKKIDSQNPELNKFQGYVKDQFSLLNAPFLRGRFLDVGGQETFNITTSGLLIEHKMQREPAGFIVTYIDANAVVWWDRSGTEDRTKFIRLDASASANIRVWCF